MPTNEAALAAIVVADLKACSPRRRLAIARFAAAQAAASARERAVKK